MRRQARDQGHGVQSPVSVILSLSGFGSFVQVEWSKDDGLWDLPFLSHEIGGFLRPLAPVH